MDTVYKVILLAGTSMDGYEGAVMNAITRASKTLKNLSWFEVVEHRGKFRPDGIEHQVKVNIGFKVEDVRG
jgi:flavin-binding protein dodecin